MNTAATKRVPDKLKHDAIVEALLDVRFDAPRTVPEVLLGRLADYEPWRNFQQRRLPLGQIPAAIRHSDRNLRYSPMFELADPANQRIVRIGEHVVSCHQLQPYVGWALFKQQLMSAVEALFSKADPVIVTRLGLRYVNALRQTTHGISGITDLDLGFYVAGQPITKNLNLNFTTDVHEATTCTVRVATKDYAVGNFPEGTSLIVDVDVSTKPSFKARDAAQVKDWIEVAHHREKEAFFGLLKPETIDRLAE